MRRQRIPGLFVSLRRETRETFIGWKECLKQNMDRQELFVFP